MFTLKTHCLSSAEPERSCTGFTLLEMSIVLAILGVLLGSLMQPLGVRLEAQKRAETRTQLRSVLAATKGFLFTQRRLPCPAVPASAGWELDACAGDRAAGFVPTATLGLNGPVDTDGLLLDSWGRRIRYVTSASDHPAYGQPAVPDFTGDGEIDRVGLRWLRSELVICTRGDIQPCPRDSVRANQVPVLVYSTGANQALTAAQQENLDNDHQFVARDYSTRSADEFDDIVEWVSENEFIYEWVRSIN